MDLLPFPTLFAIAAGALILAMTVASAMMHRPSERRIPVRSHRDDRY